MERQMADVVDFMQRGMWDEAGCALAAFILDHFDLSSEEMDEFVTSLEGDLQ